MHGPNTRRVTDKKHKWKNEGKRWDWRGLGEDHQDPQSSASSAPAVLLSFTGTGFGAAIGSFFATGLAARRRLELAVEAKLVPARIFWYFTFFPIFSQHHQLKVELSSQPNNESSTHHPEYMRESNITLPPPLLPKPEPRSSLETYISNPGKTYLVCLDGYSCLTI